MRIGGVDAGRPGDSRESCHEAYVVTLSASLLFMCENFHI